MEPKIGVYICHCGSNIAGVVDCAKVVEYARGLANVAAARDYKYMCSDPGQNLIKEDIKNLGLNRVVVASCSPRMHEPTFRACVADVGVNPYLLEMVNLREHCSWVHLHDRKGATEKAKDMVKVGVARARNLEPQIEKTVPVTKAALVIGGGVAGIQTSLDLADSGIQVYLVEKEPSIGGIMAALDKTYPTMDCSI